MNRRVPKWHAAFYKLRMLFSEEILALILVAFIFVVPAGATTRFENRSLFMQSVTPGATTSYEISLDYMTMEAVGSLDLQFCVSPIPYEPCEKPEGLDITESSLVEQAGEVGFTANIVSDTQIVLSRPSTMIAEPGHKSKYIFDNIVNPTDQTQAFSIRMKSHSSGDATGPLIDFGSVRGQVAGGITITTQVPPMLIFCVAQQVDENCVSTNENYYTDMGDLSEDGTLTAQSQFAVGTNATGGFAVAVAGNPLTAGTNVIDGIPSTAESNVGSNQFGINLVENSELNVGHDPEGTWANAVPSSDYGQPNKYKYVPGDIIAFSPNVSLIKKFTVSYIVNASPDLKAGVYTTTINYIASGRF